MIPRDEAALKTRTRWLKAKQFVNVIVGEIFSEAKRAKRRMKHNALFKHREKVALGEIFVLLMWCLG